MGENLHAALLGDGLNGKGFVFHRKRVRVIIIVPTEFVEEFFELKLAKCGFGGIG